jgi:hypothetical protein
MRGLPSTQSAQKNAKHYPPVFTAAIVTLPATPGEMHVVDTIVGSYDVTPASGFVYIGIGTPTVVRWKVNINRAGVFRVKFPRGFYWAVMNSEMRIYLNAGTPGMTGKLNVTYR